MEDKYKLLNESGRVDFKAYSAARSILRKRLERLVAKRPENIRAAQVLRLLREKMTVKAIRELPEAKQRRAAEKIKGWLTGSLSLTAVREQTLKTLRTLEEHGYTGIEAEDLANLGKAAKLAQSLAANQMVKYETALSALMTGDLPDTIDVMSSADAIELLNKILVR